MVRMVGAQFLDGHVGVLPSILSANVFANGFNLRDAVEYIGNGLREFVKCDGV